MASEGSLAYMAQVIKSPIAMLLCLQSIFGALLPNATMVPQISCPKMVGFSFTCIS
jgi:hypothetical protein